MRVCGAATRPSASIARPAQFIASQNRGRRRLLPTVSNKSTSTSRAPSVVADLLPRTAARMASAGEEGPEVIHDSTFLKGPYQLSKTASAEPPAATDADVDGKAIVIIVLNWRLPKCSLFLWEKAVFRVVADGGANRLYEEIPESVPALPKEAVRHRFIPDAIVGDLDSIRPDVRKFYEDQGVSIGDQSEDQDTNDLTKCINRCLDHMEQKGIERHKATIICLGALGGRLDHTLGNLNVLMSFPDLRLVLCGDGNLSRVLPAGRSVVRPDRSIEGPTCGLIPLGGPVTATTTGLRWNLDNMEMAFGGLVSTSNILEDDEVTVASDGPLLWTTELKDTECPLC